MCCNKSAFCEKDNQAEQHQNQLVYHCNNQQHQRGYCNIDSVPSHVIDLQRLPAGGRGRNGGKEKTNKRILDTPGEGHKAFERLHQIFNDYRFTANKEKHHGNPQQQKKGIRFRHGIKNLRNFLIFE